MKPAIVIVGAGGHAKVVADIILLEGRFELAGATDASPRGKAARACGLRVLGTDAVLKKLFSRGIRHATVGLGSIKDTGPRRRLREKLTALGFILPPLVHPSAVVARSVRLWPGAQVMAGVLINPGAVLGSNCVLNTGAVVEHDTTIGRDAFIGPGARIGGAVHVGEGAFIGIGAVLIQGVRVGARAVVGAGAVVLRDVPAGRTACGVPAAMKGNGG